MFMAIPTSLRSFRSAEGLARNDGSCRINPFRIDRLPGDGSLPFEFTELGMSRWHLGGNARSERAGLKTWHVGTCLHALSPLAPRHERQPLEQVHVLLVLDQRAGERRDQLL